jgi:hypothetical protein
VGNLTSQLSIFFCQLVDFHAQGRICCMRKSFHFFLKLFKKVKIILKFICKSLEKYFHGIPHGNNPLGLLRHNNLEHVSCSLQLIFQFYILYLQGNIFCMRKGFHLLHEINDNIYFISKIIHQLLKKCFHCVF